jgi:glycosyltransferase involved in cell wall biosynthesis
MTVQRLLLLTDAVGGVWVYSVELARALQVLGVETILAVTGPPPTSRQREAIADIPQIHTGLPLEWLETTPSEIEKAASKVARIAAHESADIVQTNSASALAGAAFDCPTVAVQHSCISTWWRAVKGTPLPDDFRWRRDLVEHGLRRSDAIVAPTRAFAEATERAYHLENVITVHNGRTWREARSLPQGDFIFTAARLWDEGKNAKTLDRAAADIDVAVQAAGPVAGPNGAQIAFENLVAVGLLSEEKLGGVLAARPIFASAAIYEPFGLAVLEAAQAGCALVLSDIATHRELWDGAAIFVHPLDANGFATVFEGLLGDPAERQRLGKAASLAARRYSIQRTARGMAEIYARLVQPQAQLIAGAA